MIKRLKDESKLVAKWKLWATKGYYFHVFLWEDRDSFEANTYGNVHGMSFGCANLAPTILEISNGEERKIIRPKLGEVHFIKGSWTLEIVAHELCHALIQKLRMITPTSEQIIEQEGECEEDTCYWFGEAVDFIYRALWEADQPNGWINNG